MIKGLINSSSLVLLQQQTVSYQNQLDRRREMLDSTESSLKTQLGQAEGQLSRARGTIDSQVYQF